jgi:hypothetical protein
VCLPIAVTDQLHVRWNEFRFDQALASVVPEEGISRLITSSKEAREDHTIRHGLAFVLEHGFMTTDEGRRQYVLNIQQIAQSVQETNNYDVLSALLNCREYEREWEKRHSMIRTPWNVLGKRERLEFGIVQKDFRGFEILHEKYKNRLQRYGVTPNMWIFPPKLALYAAFNPAVSDYAKEQTGIELKTSPSLLGSFRGLNVYETREFDVRNGELPINLLQRRVQIGEHYYMTNHHSDNEDFKTNKSMDIVIYNEDLDDWEKISYREAMNHIRRFDADGSLDTLDGRPPPKDDLFTYKTDRFSTSDTHKWCTRFGHIEDEHLPAEALRAFCESAAARFKLASNKITEEEKEGDDAGRPFVTDSDGSSYALGDLTKFLGCGELRKDDVFWSYMVDQNVYYITIDEGAGITLDALNELAKEVARLWTSLHVFKKPAIASQHKVTKKLKIGAGAQPTHSKDKITTDDIKTLLGGSSFAVTNETLSKLMVLRDYAMSGVDTIKIPRLTSWTTVDLMRTIMEKEEFRTKVKKYNKTFDDIKGNMDKGIVVVVGEENLKSELNKVNGKFKVKVLKNNEIVDFDWHGETVHPSFSERLNSLVKSKEEGSDEGSSNSRRGVSDVNIMQLLEVCLKDRATLDQLLSNDPEVVKESLLSKLLSEDLKAANSASGRPADGPTTFNFTEARQVWEDYTSKRTAFLDSVKNVDTRKKVALCMQFAVEMQINMLHEAIHDSESERFYFQYSWTSYELGKRADSVLNALFDEEERGLYKAAQEEATNTINKLYGRVGFSDEGAMMPPPQLMPKSYGEEFLKKLEPQVDSVADRERITYTLPTRLLGAQKSTRPLKRFKRGGVSDFAQTLIGANFHDDNDIAGDDVVFVKGVSGDFSKISRDDMEGFMSHNKMKKFEEKMTTLTTTLQKAIARILYVCEIKRAMLDHWMSKDICLPFSVIIARPHMTYDMCSCIMMKGGNETGATFQGHSDFQLGDDVQSKIHYGNYTYYSKAIVTNHKNIIIARNVMSNGYGGGNGCRWRTESHAHSNFGEESSGNGDMYAFLVPYNERKKNNPLKIFGKFHKQNELQTMTGSEYYRSKWNIDQTVGDDYFTTQSEKEDSNDICYMGHHFWWKPHREAPAQTKVAGSYTGVTVNTGHWGDRVYPGCARVRAGDEVYLKECNYGQEPF